MVSLQAHCLSFFPADSLFNEVKKDIDLFTSSKKQTVREVATQVASGERMQGHGPACRRPFVGG
jgi:hypothetical protein